MGKRGSFIIVSLILLLIAFGNVFIYFEKAGMSTFAIKDITAKLIQYDLSTIIFVAQWVLIFLIVVIFFVKFLRRKKGDRAKHMEIKVEERRGTGTDLDTLYNLLQEKKNLKISEIARIFKITNDKALEWCRILENHELVSTEYPAFSEPEVEIK